MGVENTVGSLCDCDIVDSVGKLCEMLRSVSDANLNKKDLHTVSLNLAPRPYATGHILSSKNATRNKLTFFD